MQRDVIAILASDLHYCSTNAALLTLSGSLIAGYGGGKPFDADTVVITPVVGSVQQLSALERLNGTTLLDALLFSGFPVKSGRSCFSRNRVLAGLDTMAIIANASISVACRPAREDLYGPIMRLIDPRAVDCSSIDEATRRACIKELATQLLASGNFGGACAESADLARAIASVNRAC